MADYPIPSWLGPQPHYGELYARGLSIGAQISAQRAAVQEAQARLEQAAIQSQMESQLQQMALKEKSRIADMEARQRSQEAAIEADYKRMQLGQAQQKIALDAQQYEQRMAVDVAKFNLDWRQASQKFEGQRLIEEGIKARVARGEPLEEATKKEWLRYGHLAGGLPAGALPRPAAPRQPPAVFNIPSGVPGQPPVQVVQGGTINYGPGVGGSGAPTMVAPGVAEFQGPRGPVLRNVNTTFKHPADAAIQKLKNDLELGPYLEDESQDKGMNKNLLFRVKAARKRLQELKAERDAALKVHMSVMPKLPGQSAEDDEDIIDFSTETGDFE